MLPFTWGFGMNTKQTAKMTGIPEQILIRMRARETTSLKSGPPFCKKMGKEGEIEYSYHKADVQRWMKARNCLITAADAARILGCSREDILSIYGLQSLPIRARGFNGRLLINNGKNIYVWIPDKLKKPFIRNMRVA